MSICIHSHLPRRGLWQAVDAALKSTQRRLDIQSIVNIETIDSKSFSCLDKHASLYFLLQGPKQTPSLNTLICQPFNVFRVLFSLRLQCNAHGKNSAVEQLRPTVCFPFVSRSKCCRAKLSRLSLRNDHKYTKSIDFTRCREKMSRVSLFIVLSVSQRAW